MIDLSFLVSLLSISISIYALHRRGPIGPEGPQGLPGQQGFKGDTGDTGARGPQGEPVDRSRARTVTKIEEPRPTILSKQERREAIKAKADDPDFETQIEEIRERLRDGSGLIASDPNAQTNQPDWRRRNAK